MHFQPISQNEELRVWYAEHYAQALGEHLLGSNIVSEVQPQQTPKKVATGQWEQAIQISLSYKYIICLHCDLDVCIVCDLDLFTNYLPELL